MLLTRTSYEIPNCVLTLDTEILLFLILFLFSHFSGEKAIAERLCSYQSDQIGAWYVTCHPSTSLTIGKSTTSPFRILLNYSDSVGAFDWTTLPCPTFTTSRNGGGATSPMTLDRPLEESYIFVFGEGERMRKLKFLSRHIRNGARHCNALIVI